MELVAHISHLGFWIWAVYMNINLNTIFNVLTTWEKILVLFALSQLVILVPMFFSPPLNDTEVICKICTQSEGWILLMIFIFSGVRGCQLLRSNHLFPLSRGEPETVSGSPSWLQGPEYDPGPGLWQLHACSPFRSQGSIRPQLPHYEWEPGLGSRPINNAEYTRQNETKSLRSCNYRRTGHSVPYYRDLPPSN